MTTELKIAKHHRTTTRAVTHLYYSVELSPVEISPPGELGKVPAGCWCVSPVQLHSDLAHAGLQADGWWLPTFVWYRHFCSEMKTPLQKMLFYEESFT